MRSFGILTFCLLSSSVLALDYPDLSNPTAKQLLAQYIQDKPLIDSPDLLVIPNPLPAWPCEVSEVDQYKLAGLERAHPELKAAHDKEMRKMIRDWESTAILNSKTTYSNIQIIPLKAQCVDGKLDGDIELLSIYDERLEVPATMQMGESIVNSLSLMDTHSISRIHKNTIKGEVDSNNIFKSFMQRSSKHTQTSDNAAMTKTIEQQKKILGDKPTIIRSITYNAPDGTIAQFMEIDETQVTGGLFGVKTKTVPVLTTMVTFPIDEHRKIQESYRNKQLTSRTPLKDNKMHGEQVLWGENYLKKYKMRLDQQPNMENSREVTINGVDLIETRNCMQDGVMVKISPCPTE